MKRAFFDTVWNDKFGRLLSAGLCVLFAWSAFAPHGRGIWYVESATALAAYAVFALFAGNFKFSRTAYAIFCLWEAMQIVGAHYSFELVPFDWITNTIGASRNHYDRVAHFAVGLNAYAVAEYLRGRGIVNSTKSAAVFGVKVTDYDKASVILESVNTESENDDILKYYKKYYLSRMEAVRGGSVAIESVSKSER